MALGCGEPQYEAELRVDEILPLCHGQSTLQALSAAPGQVAAEISWRCGAQHLTAERLAGQPCRKGTDMSIARILPVVVAGCYAITGGQQKMSGKPFGYARVSVASDADANNLENQRRVLADCEEVFEGMGSGVSWNRPGLNRLRVVLQQCPPDLRMGP